MGYELRGIKYYINTLKEAQCERQHCLLTQLYQFPYEVKSRPLLLLEPERTEQKPANLSCLTREAYSFNMMTD
jgi:hypothetical protein